MQQGGKLFRFFNGNRANQHRLTVGVPLRNILHHGVKFAGLGAVNNIRLIQTLNRLVGGDLHHIQAVNGLKLIFLCHSRTGHAGNLLVHTEVILQGNAGQRLALIFNNHIFFGFNSLVQTVAVAAAVHQAAGEFVNNNHLAVFHHVIPVTLKQKFCFQSLLYIMVNFRVGVIVKVGNAQQVLSFGHAIRGQHNRASLFVNGKILVAPHTGGDFSHLIVALGGLFRLAADNQRGAGFIN